MRFSAEIAMKDYLDAHPEGRGSEAQNLMLRALTLLSLLRIDHESMMQANAFLADLAGYTGFNDRDWECIANILWAWNHAPGSDPSLLRTNGSKRLIERLEVKP